MGLSGATKIQLEISNPELGTKSVEDPFKGLGPLALFSAKREWSAPRHVTLHKRGDGFGLSVKGNAPVMIASVDPQSPAKVTIDTVLFSCGSLNMVLNVLKCYIFDVMMPCLDGGSSNWRCYSWNWG